MSTFVKRLAATAAAVCVATTAALAVAAPANAATCGAGTNWAKPKHYGVFRTSTVSTDRGRLQGTVTLTAQGQVFVAMTTTNAGGTSSYTETGSWNLDGGHLKRLHVQWSDDADEGAVAIYQTAVTCNAYGGVMTSKGTFVDGGGSGIPMTMTHT